MLRWIMLLLVVMLLGLQWMLWLGDGGMREVRWLRQQVQVQSAQNADMERRNQALAAEVDDLKQGRQAIEGRARSSLGLILPGEVFYQVVEPAQADSGERDGD